MSASAVAMGGITYIDDQGIAQVAEYGLVISFSDKESARKAFAEGRVSFGFFGEDADPVTTDVVAGVEA